MKNSAELYQRNLPEKFGSDFKKPYLGAKSHTAAYIVYFQGTITIWHLFRSRFACMVYYGFFDSKPDFVKVVFSPYKSFIFPLLRGIFPLLYRNAIDSSVRGGLKQLIVKLKSHISIVCNKKLRIQGEGGIPESMALLIPKSRCKDYTIEGGAGCVP